MNKIKILIGCLVIAVLVLFGINQYNQYQSVQDQKIIENQTKIDNDKMRENLEKETQKGKDLKLIGGTL